jgi:hypothetical protein
MKINFGGKDRGFQWGMGCLEKYCDLMDCDIEGLDMAFLPGRSQNRAMTNLLLAAMHNFAELNDEVIDFNYVKIQAWLDEAPQDTLTQLLENFKKSKYLGRTIEDFFAMNEEPEADVKKK